MFAAIPLLVVPMAAYFLVTGILGVSALDRGLFTLPLPSGVPFAFTIGAAILTLSLAMLLVEVLKATNTKNASSILDHALSTVLVMAGLLAFVLMPAAGTTVFLVILLAGFIDVIAGFSVSIRTAQRDIAVDKTQI
jgi:hypothetical protein